MTKQNHLELVRDILRTTANVEGAGLAREVEAVLSEYQTFINTTPVPETVAKWVGDLYDLLDNCEGAELERELADLKSPYRASV